MTPRHPPNSSVTRALASGLAALYFLTNVAAGHAAESNFWKDRRRAASLQWGEPTAEAPSRGGSLYARLPTAPSQGPDLSSLWEQPVHRVSQDLAESATKNIVRGPDARLMAVAQAVAPFGQVRRVKAATSPDAPLILHIQDVHGNPQAQRNMSGMVLALAQKQSPLVGLEGASGAFEMESFHAYPDLDIVKSVADYFLEKDLIGGPEHAGLVAPRPLTLWGVEDPGLYLAHVAAVKESLAGRGRADAFLGQWAAAIEALKKAHYSPALHDFDKNQNLYERDQRGLGEYVENLKGFQKSLSVQEFPNVEKLLLAARREKTMDFEAVENERRALVEGLATRLSVPELQDLVRRSLDLKAGTLRQRDYQTHLRDLCARHKLALSRFPRLVGYMDYVADSESIEREALLNELDRLETAAQDALARTPVQRDIVSLTRDLARLSKLVANEMTPADWSAFEPRRAAMARLGARLKALPGGRAVETPADWEGFVRPYEEFCRKALARNSALADRTLEKMKNERKSTALLVAGGFHTDGLVDLLAARGATVVVLTPKIGPVDGASNYLDVFARDPLPVEKIFAGEPIALKDRCGLGGGELAGEQTARVHAAVAGRTLMVAWEDLRGLGHNARTILRELRERLLSLSQEVAGLSLIHPRVRAVGADGLTFSYMAPNGREESVSFRETDDGIVASGRRWSGPGVWWRGATGWVARLLTPRPTSREIADRPLLAAGAVETPALSRPDPLAREWAVAWRESFGFLRPLAFFQAHTTWSGAERVIGALLIVGMWALMGETVSVIFNWAQQAEGIYSPLSLALGLSLGWAATIPFHAGWNLVAHHVNEILARRGISFRLPRLTVFEDMTTEFEAIEANLQTLRNSLMFLEKQEVNPSTRLQVVELYLQTIDRLSRLMGDMGKYLPKANVVKFRSRIFNSQDWLPPPGKIINLIELIGRDGNFQTAHGFLGQIGRYPEFVSPLDMARLKDTQTSLRQAAVQAETQRMKGVRPNGKQVRAITTTLALNKAQEHWLDVYAALERQGLAVSFERMAAVGKRTPAEYQRIWENELGAILEDNWAGEIKSLAGEEMLRDDLKTALDLLVESEPTAEGFLKKWPTAEALIGNMTETSGHPESLVALWLNVGTKKGDYAKLVNRLTAASPMAIVDQNGTEWRVMAVPKVFKNFKPSMAGIVSSLARKLIDLGDGGQTRGDEYSRRGILREVWGTDWWIFGKKLADEKTLMIYWFGSGSKAHAPGDSYAANPAVRNEVFSNDDNYDISNAVIVMSDLTERVPPKGGALTLQETYDTFAGTLFGGWVRARFGEVVFRRTTEIVAAPWFEFAKLNDAKAFADAHTHLNASERNLRRWATYGIHGVAAGVSGLVAFGLAGLVVSPVASVGGLLGIGLSGLALAPPLVVVGLALFLGPALGFLSTIPTHTLWNLTNAFRRETRPVAENIAVQINKFTDSFIQNLQFSIAGALDVYLKQQGVVFNPTAPSAGVDFWRGLKSDVGFSEKTLDISRIIRRSIAPKQEITDVFPPSMTFGLEIEFHKDKQPEPDVIGQIEPILKKYGWHIEPSELGTYLFEIRNSSDKKEILRNTPEDWQRLKDCLEALQSGPLAGGFYSVHMHVGQEGVTGEDLIEKREALGRIAKAYEALWRALSGRGYSVPGGNLTVLGTGALTGTDKTVIYHSSIINMSKMYPTIEIKIISGLLNDRGHLDIENLQEQLWFAFALFRAAVHRGDDTPLALMGRPVVAGEKPSDRQIEAFLDRIYQGDPRGRSIARRVFDRLAGEVPGLTPVRLAEEQSKIKKAYESAGLGVLYRLHNEAEGHIDYEIVEHLLEPSRLETLAADLVAAGASDEQALAFFPGDMYVPLLEALKAARAKLASQFELRPEDYQRRIADLMRIYNPVVPRVEFSRYLREIRVDPVRDRLARGLFDEALRGRGELAPLRRLYLEPLRHFNVEPIRLNIPSTLTEIRPISSFKFDFTEIKLPWWFRTAVAVQKLFSLAGFFGIPLIPTSFPWIVVSAISALSQTVKSVSAFFRSSPFLPGLVLPLVETMMLLSLNPSLEHWFAALGMDPTGGVLALSAGLVFSLPHILSRSLAGEQIPAKDIAIWTGAGALFSALLTIPGGFALSLGLHAALNNILLAARQEGSQKRFPRLSSLLSKIPLFSIAPIGTQGGIPSARSAPRSTLLTDERLRRNKEIAAQTGGRKTVLYFGAGLDLSGVLTTFPEAEHVRMVALAYGPVDVDVVRDYMENPRVGDAAINEYVEHVTKSGYAPSGLVDDLSKQLKLLATELTALGVNPQTLSLAPVGNGIEFTPPWNPSGKIAVTFSGSPAGGIRLTDSVGAGWTESIGNLRFDGFYFKAGEKVAREFSSLLARASEFFSNNVLLVVNNIPRDGNLKGSFKAPPGYSLGEPRLVGVDSAGNYGNAFAVLEMKKGRTKAAPAGAIPAVVNWLKNRGHDTAAAIRKAPLIESGLFSVAFLVPFAMAILGVDGATWAAGGTYALMNAYFGLKHTRVYRFQNGQWVEGLSTWKTKAWLMGVGAVVHAPLLVLAFNPLTGPIGMLAMYAGGALASVGLHRLYNAIAGKAGWPAATVPEESPNARMERARIAYRVLIHLTKRLTNNETPEREEETRMIQNITLIRVYQDLVYFGLRNEAGQRARSALRPEERSALSSFFLGELNILNKALVDKTNELSAIDGQRAYTSAPIVQTPESKRLRAEIGRMHSELLPILQTYALLGDGATPEFRQNLAYQLAGILNHPMVDVNLKESFSRFLADRMLLEDDEFSAEVLFNSLVPVEAMLPRGREFWRTVFTDAWPRGQNPNELLGLLDPADRSQRRLGLAVISIYSREEERLLGLISDSQMPMAFRLLALQKVGRRPKGKESTIQTLQGMMDDADFQKDVLEFIRKQSDDARWTADLFENPLFASEDGNAFLTGIAVVMRSAIGEKGWDTFQSLSASIGRARFLSYWDNAHSQMSFGGTLFRSYRRGAQYNGRLLAMVAAHEMTHAFLHSVGYGYETPTEKRLHEFLSDMGTNSLSDALRFSSGDVMAYAQTAGFFFPQDGDGGVDNQHARARRQLLLFNEALNRSIGTWHFSPSALVTAGLDLIRRGAANAADPNLTFANLFRTFLGLDTLSAGEMGENLLENGLIATATLEAWFAARPSGPPTVLETPVSPPGGFLARWTRRLFGSTPVPPPASRFQSERIGNRWVVSDGRGWRVELPVLPVQSLDGQPFSTHLSAGYLEASLGNQRVTSFRGVADDVSFEETIEILDKLFKETVAAGVFPRVLGVHVVPGSSVPRLVLESFPIADSFENRGLQRLTPELDRQMATLFSDRLMERFRSGAFNLDQGIYHRHFYLIDGKVRFRLPVETYALKRFFEYFKSKPTVPAGAIPGVVHWLKARGNDTAAAIGKAPWIESGLFATAFLVPALMVVSGVPVPVWAAGGLYALSNAYFGQKHSRVYRFDGLRWVVGPSTWKTRLWLAAVGVVVHLPVLLATLNPLAGPVGFLGLYAGAAAASVGLHRWYNKWAQRSGWVAATILPTIVRQQREPAPGPVVGEAWNAPVQFKLLTSNQLAKALFSAWESRDLSKLRELALSRGLNLDTLNSLLERSGGEPGEFTERRIQALFGVFKEFDFKNIRIEASKGRGLGREIDLSVQFLNSLTKEEVALAFRNMFGIRVSAGDISDQVDLEYLHVDQAEHKHVFKAHFRLRGVPAGQEDLSLAILKEEKSGLGPGRNITDRELEDLVNLRDTGYVPRVGLVGQLDDGSRVIIEPFIPGLTLTELNDKGGLTNSLRTRVARVLFSIAHELNGKIPYDSHGGNFIHDSTGDRLVMVDIGEMREEISPGRMTPAKREGLIRVVRNLFEDYGDITGADVEANEALLKGVLEAGRTLGMGILKAVAEIPDQEQTRIQDPDARKAISIARNYYEKIRSPGSMAQGSQVPAAAIPGVVEWLRAQGLTTAAAIRKAPLIESGLFSVAFFVVLALAMVGVDGGAWAASGVYGLMNAYFGYRHDTVFRYRNGTWVETRGTWKTRLGLMGVGLAIHAPLLLSAWSAPFVGGLWFAVLYPILAAASVSAHRWYNEWAKERGWPAATVPTDRPAAPGPGGVIGEGSFFIVTDEGNGILRKEVKEFVGPPSRLYRLSEAEREKAAALVVEHTNRIRRSVNDQLKVRNREKLANKNFLPYLRREGRFIFVEKVPGVPFNEAVMAMSEGMAEEARRDIRGAVRAASEVFDLKYDQMLEREDGWRIGVDNRRENFLFVGDDLTGWIDAISPWPPESRRVSGPGEPLPMEAPATGTGVRVDFDGPMPRVTGWTSPLERAAFADVQSRVAALVKGMPPLRSETRNGFQAEAMDMRGHKWPASYRGQEGDAHLFEIQSNGKSYWVKIAFGLGSYALANAAAGAAPAIGVPGVRALVDFAVTDAPLRYSYLVTEAPIGQPVGEVLTPATQNPVETRDAVLARIEAIPAEQVRAAHETVRALADHGLSVNPALTRYDNRSGFVFEGLTNDADPLQQQALEWFPVRNTPDETAREVVARVLSAVAGVSPSNLNPYYDAAREKVAAATLSPRPAYRRLAAILVDNLRRAWREQIDALRPGNLFPAGFSARQVTQSAFLMVGLLTATVDAVAASVGVALGGKTATLAQTLSFGTVVGLFAAGWRAVTSLARESSSVDVIRTDEVVANPFGWRVDGESLIEDARLGLAKDLGQLLLGGVSRPVWLGFKDLRRSYRSTAADPAPSIRASFRAHLSDMARGQGRDYILPEDSLWGVRENEVFRAATLRKGQVWGGITLSRWALAEMILATATPFQRAMPWFHRSVRWALGVESDFLERGASRSQTDRLTRAARAIAVLRAAGFSLSSPNSFLNQDVSQEQDRRLLLNAAGVANADVSLVEEAYNAALEKIAATNLWNNAATAAFVRLKGGRAFLREGVPAGGPTGTLYFNIDALVQADAATEEQRGRVAESLEGVLSALSGEYLRDRLVLTTSLSGDPVAAETLIERLTREFGPSFKALRDLTVLTGESAPDLYEEGALRLSVLADHAKGRGTGEFEVWTHDAKKVLRDKPGLEKILVVDILDIAVKFDRMLRQMRFLATNA